RPRSGSDENVLRCYFFSVDFHFVSAANRRPATKDLDAGQGEHALVDAVQARDLLVLVREQGAPVEARLADGPAEAAGDFEVFAEVGGVGKKLLRDAADVHAGAAEAVGLGD